MWGGRQASPYRTKTSKCKLIALPPTWPFQFQTLPGIKGIRPFRIQSPGIPGLPFQSGAEPWLVKQIFSTVWIQIQTFERVVHTFRFLGSFGELLIIEGKSLPHPVRVSSMLASLTKCRIRQQFRKSVFPMITWTTFKALTGGELLWAPLLEPF